MSFARRITTWQARHGRRDLPWQKVRDPYALWVSEIMLQQTQVATVIPYYLRFMVSLPDVRALAAAPSDEVMALWSGLGYYSRARNLQRAAQIICERHAGCFPRTIEEIEALPGIGRSTAGAIMVFAYGGRHPILDGNVKRVLARVCGIVGYAGEKEVGDALWRAAIKRLPPARLETYTQGLMDLGATVCVRRPRCGKCPVRTLCVAARDGRVNEIPAPRPRKALPHRTTTMLVLDHAGEVLLEKRPAPGIWGGLWCLPELDRGADAAAACEQRFGAHIASLQALEKVEHGFTHFSLTILPQRAPVTALVPRVGETVHQWLPIGLAKAAGIPSPVRKILESLQARQPGAT